MDSDDDDSNDEDDDKQEDKDEQNLEQKDAATSEKGNSDDDGIEDAKTQGQTGPARNTRSSRRKSPVRIDAPATTAQKRRDLERETKKSKDKLFFVQRQRPRHKKNSWHLVQVDEEETNWRRARQEGIYHVRHCVCSLADSRKKKIRECAYWPETHEFKRDGETMGPMVPTKPQKVDRLLSEKSYRFMWHQDTIDLFEAKLVGPFDFDQGYTVAKQVWDQLLDVAKHYSIYMANINRIVPLDKPDFQDKDEKDNPASYLGFRWKIDLGYE